MRGFVELAFARKLNESLIIQRLLRMLLPMHSTSVDTREVILNAAVQRIMHYGYGKTTMSEIARDCNMSAGNIYRFFASKLDIAEAMARKFNLEFLDQYAAITRKPLPAAERMREFFHFSLMQTYNAIAEDAKILEVANVLKMERPLVFNEQLAQERVYLNKLIEDGIAAGAFRPVDNIDTTTEFMQSALMKYRFPQLFSMLTLPKLQRELDGVMDLLLAGLSVGATPPRRT
jgi:AcrR family transcriptional regulator